MGFEWKETKKLQVKNKKRKSIAMASCWQMLPQTKSAKVPIEVNLFWNFR